jgi:Opioid growth factor receptor (OGFr) conserved region
MQAWSDDDLERTYNYVQWLFPLAEPSGFNIDAPVLDDDTISLFRANSGLRRRLETARPRFDLTPRVKSSLRSSFARIFFSVRDLARCSRERRDEDCSI